MSKNEQRRRLRWIAEVEETIAALEDEKDQAVAAMGTGVDAARLLELGSRCATIDGELAELMAKWEYWHREMEKDP